MKSQRGLTVFGAVAFGPGSNQPSDYSATAGVVYLGALVAWPLDRLRRRPSNLIMAEINYDIVCPERSI